MLNLIWTTVLGSRKILYWHYDLCTKEFKVTHKKLDADMLVLVAEEDDSFIAKFKLTQQYITDLSCEPMFGVEIHRNNDLRFYIGEVYELFFIILKTDLPIGYVSQRVDGFAHDELWLENGIICMTVPLVAAKVILEDKNFRNEVLKYMTFTVKYKGNDDSCIIGAY